MKPWMRLFTAFFVSEIGGYLTNTVILFHLYDSTGGDKFILGLAQILFVGPLALGGLLGGPLGESFNRRRIMVLCELSNLFLLTLVIYSFHHIGLLIALRAVIVFFAGIYNPSRQSIVRELVSPEKLPVVNSWFTCAYAFFHSVGPLLSTLAYKEFNGVVEVFSINVFCYAVAILFLLSLRSAHTQSQPLPVREPLAHQFKEGIRLILHRPDLKALLRNFSLAGVCLGVFFPTSLPFLSEVFHGDKALYGQMMMMMGVGGIGGGLLSPHLLKRFSRGPILVVVSFIQALLLLLWTQITWLPLSLAVIFVWGIGIVTFTSTYINYIQMEVSQQFQARAFSIYDNSMSLSVILGAGLVSLVGDQLSAQNLLALTAATALAVLTLTAFSHGVRALYKMEVSP